MRLFARQNLADTCMLICAKIVGHKPNHQLLSQRNLATDRAMPRRKPKSSPAEKESSSEPGRPHLQEEERKQSAVDAVKDSPDGASFSGQSDPEQPPHTVKRLKEENECERELPIKKKPRGKQKVEAKEELMEKKMAKKEETHPAEESGGELPIKKKPKGKQKVEAKEELMEREESHPAATQKVTMRKGKGKAVTKLPDPEDGEKESQGDAVEALPQKQFWLMKSEPESRMQKGVDVKFSIEDLQNEPEQTTCWDGVRSYQGRNIMRDKMRVGDLAFFYHSNCKDPGIVGGSVVN